MHHHHVSANHNKHHYRFHHSSTAPNEPWTDEGQVKVAKASIIIRSFIIFFAISLMIGLSDLVLPSDDILNLLLIPFILFPTIALIASAIQIVRYVHFLKSEPTSSER